MSSEWTWVTFGDGPLKIIDGDRGKNYPSQNDFNSSGHCLFLNAGNVTKNGFAFSDRAFISNAKDASLGKGKLQLGDVVLTTRGTVGNSAYFDATIPLANIRINSGMVVLRAQSAALHPRFLYFFVRSELFRRQVAGLLTGSAQPQLPVRDLNRIRMPLPSLAEQRIMVRILGALDDKIELSRKMSATLEAIARALFKSWFVDFDPVRAKAEGRDPGLPAEIAAVFPDSFEETAHGQIPSGWRLVSLNEMVEINPSTSLAGISEAPYLDMSNVPTRGHAVDTVITRTVSSGSRFKLGDTLLARITPCLENGKTAFVDFLPEGLVGWGSTEFIVMRPRDPMPKEYGYLLSRSEAFRAYAIGKMTGTSGRQRVPTDSLASYSVVQPCAAMCAVFALVIQPIFMRMSAVSLDSRTLAALRDTLLPKLISGEVRVADAGRGLAASA